jgi:hypothetical protein
MPTTTYQRKQYNRKPATPQQQLAKAIERAQAEGLKVYATCKILATGEQGWLVPSQSVPGMMHVISRSASGSLACDCYYSSQQHKVCAHRACVFLFLKGQPKAQPAPKINTVMVSCVIGEHENCHIDGCSCSCHKANKNAPKAAPAPAPAQTVVSTPPAQPQQTKTPPASVLVSSGPSVADRWGDYQDARLRNWE